MTSFFISLSYLCTNLFRQTVILNIHRRYVITIIRRRYFSLVFIRDELHPLLPRHQGFSFLCFYNLFFPSWFFRLSFDDFFLHYGYYRLTRNASSGPFHRWCRLFNYILLLSWRNNIYNRHRNTRGWRFLCPLAAWRSFQRRV